jgi:predicted MFS family arabinose efflux permease
MITDEPMNALERRTVASLVTLYNFRLLGLFMVLPLLTVYGSDLPGATPVLLGIAIGIYGLTQGLLQIPFGMLSDRIGRKPVIVAGLVIFALGSLIAGLADSLTGLIVGRALQGAGAIASAVMALLADLTRDSQRTKAMALVGISIGLSFVLALMVGPVVGAIAGLDGVFYLTAALAVLGIVLVLFWVPAPSQPARRHREVGTIPSLLGGCLRHPELRRLDAGIFVLHFLLMVVFLIIPSRLENAFELFRDDHWRVYLPVILASVAGLLPLLRLSERSGRVREAFLLGIALLALSFALLWLWPSLPALVCALWLFFVGFNYMEAALPSLVSKHAGPEARGTAMGIYATSQYLGTFVGGLSGGALLQWAGVESALAVCLAITLLWAALAVRMALPVATTRPADDELVSNGRP